MSEPHVYVESQRHNRCLFCGMGPEAPHLPALASAACPPACGTCEDSGRIPSHGNFRGLHPCPDCAKDTQPPAADEVVVARGRYDDASGCVYDGDWTSMAYLALRFKTLRPLHGKQVELVIRPTAARGERRSHQTPPSVDGHYFRAASRGNGWGPDQRRPAGEGGER